MNLFKKLMNYFYYKKKNLRNAYKVSADYPMTAGDKLAIIITIILGVVFVFSFLYCEYKREQNVNIVLTNEFKGRIVYLNKQIEKERALTLKNELLLISVMNGSIKERGCVVKYKRIGCEL